MASGIKPEVIGRHTPHHRIAGWRLAPLLAVTAGLLATTASWWAADGLAHRRLRETFVRLAEERAKAIEHTMHDELIVLRSVSALFRAREDVDRAAFAAFVSPLLREADAAHGFSWIPRVPASERAAYEEAARRDGLREFRFWERGPNGPREVTFRDEYLPVYFLEPRQRNGPAFGFDLASEANRREALRRAAETGAAAATARITLVQETGDQYAVLMVLPRYASGSAPATVEERRDRLRGYFTGVLRVGDAVASAIATVDAAGIDLVVTDTSAPNGEGLLAVHRSPVRLPEEADGPRPLSDLRHESSFDVGGRQWMVTATPTEAFIATQTSHLPSGVFLTGLMATALFSWSLVALMHRATVLRNVNERLEVVITERGRAEAALRVEERTTRETKRQLSTLIDNLPGMVYRCRNDEDWTMEFVSDGCAAVTGYTVEDLLDKTPVSLGDLVHPDDREELWEKCQASLDAGVPCRNIYRIISQSGAEKWVWDQGKGIYSPTGALIAIEGFILDVTDRMRAEETLGRFKEILDATTDFVGIADGRGRTMYMNRSCREALGLGPNEDLTDRRIASYHPPEAACRLVEESIPMAIRDGVWSGETVFQHCNGVDIPTLQVLMAHTDGKGEVKYFSMIARDITERKRAERSVAESEARYRTLFENAPEAVIVVDGDTRRFVDANENALRLFGLSREALLRTGPLELSPSVQPGGASSASLFRRYLRRALRGKTPAFEWSHVDAAGSIIPCEMRFVRLPGQRRLVRGSITDITERKRAEDRQRLLAHELDHRVKNNLAAVLALCDQTAASTRSLEEFQRDFAGRIRAMASTHEALARGRWSGVALVDAVQLAVRPYDFGNASRIKTAGERTVLPSRLASPLGLALHELATNAAKYGSLSSADGRVEVEWTRGEDRGLRLSWTERNGPAVQDPSREGLGLRLVRGLVEHEIGGTVRFEFNPDGLVCDMLLPAA